MVRAESSDHAQGTSPVGKRKQERKRLLIEAQATQPEVLARHIAEARQTSNPMVRTGKVHEPAPITSLYELKPHRAYADGRDGTMEVYAAGERIRRYARHLEQNHDLAKGALDRLVQFIVGPSGIAIEPVPKTLTGEIHVAFQEQLRAAWFDWCNYPEVTRQLDWIAVQRLMCRSWLRDGECLAQLVAGQVPNMRHGSRTPFSLELLEADLLPFEYNDPTNNIVNGVQRDVWNQPILYWLYKYHPGGIIPGDFTKIPVLAQNILHLKLADRIGQVRGVSVFASVLARLNDLYEYENAERVAARMAASYSGSLKTEYPDPVPPPPGHPGEEGDRNLVMKPGTILDNLRPGESLDIVASNRPSALLEPFRASQLRAVAAGLGISYSSLARDYNGTWSAQRQELIESAGHYESLSRLFINQFIRPAWETFVASAVSARVVALPHDIDLRTIDYAEFQPPPIPWVDPVKEATALAIQLANGLISPQQAIRKLGRNPNEVLNLIKVWRDTCEELGIPPDLGTAPVLPAQTPKDPIQQTPPPDNSDDNTPADDRTEPSEGDPIGDNE